jgi:hypothetical protein
MSSGILALDLDGVIGDGQLGIMKRKYGIKPDLQSFIDLYPHNVGNRMECQIGLADISTVCKDPIILISDLIIRYNLQVVVVSSWMSDRHPDAHQWVGKMFQHVVPQLPLDSFVGQTHGGGGRHREMNFCRFVREHYSDWDPMNILIIDDSGDRHFPTLIANTVAPRGRVGFNMYDHDKAELILDYDNPELSWQRTYTELDELPKDIKYTWEQVMDIGNQ